MADMFTLCLECKEPMRRSALATHTCKPTSRTPERLSGGTRMSGSYSPRGDPSPSSPHPPVRVSQQQPQTDSSKATMTVQNTKTNTRQALTTSPPPRAPASAALRTEGKAGSEASKEERVNSMENKHRYSSEELHRQNRVNSQPQSATSSPPLPVAHGTDPIAASGSLRGTTSSEFVTPRGSSDPATHSANSTSASSQRSSRGDGAHERSAEPQVPRIRISLSPCSTPTCGCARMGSEERSQQRRTTSNSTEHSHEETVDRRGSSGSRSPSLPSSSGLPTTRESSSDAAPRRRRDLAELRSPSTPPAKGALGSSAPPPPPRERHDGNRSGSGLGRIELSPPTSPDPADALLASLRGSEHRSRIRSQHQPSPPPSDASRSSHLRPAEEESQGHASAQLERLLTPEVCAALEEMLLSATTGQLASTKETNRPRDESKDRHQQEQMDALTVELHALRRAHKEHADHQRRSDAVIVELHHALDGATARVEALEAANEDLRRAVAALTTHSEAMVSAHQELLGDVKKHFTALQARMDAALRAAEDTTVDRLEERDRIWGSELVKLQDGLEALTRHGESKRVPAASPGSAAPVDSDCGDAQLCVPSKTLAASTSALQSILDSSAGSGKTPTAGAGMFSGSAIQYPPTHGPAASPPPPPLPAAASLDQVPPLPSRPHWRPHSADHPPTFQPKPQRPTPSVFSDLALIKSPEPRQPQLFSVPSDGFNDHDALPSWVVNHASPYASQTPRNIPRGGSVTPGPSFFPANPSLYSTPLRPPQETADRVVSKLMGPPSVVVSSGSKWAMSAGQRHH